jgi:hypothetical protein
MLGGVGIRPDSAILRQQSTITEIRRRLSGSEHLQMFICEFGLIRLQTLLNLGNSAAAIDEPPSLAVGFRCFFEMSPTTQTAEGMPIKPIVHFDYWTGAAHENQKTIQEEYQC